MGRDLVLFTSEVDTTGDGSVRIGGAVVPRDLAIAYAVRLLDAAHVAASELPPALAVEVEGARRALAFLDELFAGGWAIPCRVEGEEGQRRLPVARIDQRRAYVRIGALVTGLVVRGGPDRSWRGFQQVWRSGVFGPECAIDPGYRRVWARRQQIEAAPLHRALEAR